MARPGAVRELSISISNLPRLWPRCARRMVSHLGASPKSRCEDRSASWSDHRECQAQERDAADEQAPAILLQLGLVCGELAGARCEGTSQNDAACADYDEHRRPRLVISCRCYATFA